MNKNLDSNISPTGLGESTKIQTGVRKLSKMPIVIISIVLIIILLGLGYATIKRAEKSKNAEELQGKVRNDGESLASDFISKLYQARNISKDKEELHQLEKQSRIPVIDIVEKKSLTTTDSNPLNSSSADQELKKRLLEEKLALERYKKELYKTALTAPTKVQLKLSSAQTTRGGLSNGSRVMPPDPTKIYNQIAKAYKGNNHSKETRNLNSNEMFLKNQKQSFNYLSAKKTKPVSPYEMKTGTLIPSVLITKLNSDLPGPIKAQVSENIFDTATGEHLLIPQGSTLVGAYASNIQYGQNRVLIAFNRIVFPDGQTLNLGGMNGINQQGASGFNDQINNHYFKIFGSALLMGAITGGIAAADNTRTDQFIETNRQKMLGALISELGQVARQMIQKNMNIAPTLEIRAGYRFNIFNTQDIVLEPLEY